MLTVAKMTHLPVAQYRSVRVYELVSRCMAVLCFVTDLKKTDIYIYIFGNS
jgi:hypothetical protein